MRMVQKAKQDPELYVALRHFLTWVLTVNLGKFGISVLHDVSNLHVLKWQKFKRNQFDLNTQDLELRFTCRKI